MSEKTYKNIIWYGLALVMIFAPIARGAMRWWAASIIEMIVFSLIFVWLWHVNNRIPKTKYQKTKLDLAVCLFAVLAIVSTIFSTYKYASIQAMLRLLAAAGVFYLIVNNLGRRRCIRFALFITVIGIALSLFGLAQYFLGLDHSWWVPNRFLASTYVNHNHFAGYLELAIPLTLGFLIVLFLKTTALKYKIFAISGLTLALLVMLAAFVFSQSRGAWISLTIAVIIMNLILVRRGILNEKRLIVLVLFIVLGTVYIYGGYDPVSERLGTLSNIKEGVFDETRIKIWTGSIKMITANWMTGTGIGTFVWAFPGYRPAGLMVRAHFAHNDYLHMMAGMGVLALPLMIWILYLVIGTGFKSYGTKKFDLIDGIALGSACGILSLAIHGLVDFNFNILANFLVVALLAGIIMWRDSYRRSNA